MPKKLLIIIPDRLSLLIQKGEVVPRYYNPGNLFNEVHIMMTNDDKPDPKLVQPMVGDAQLFLHNFSPPDHFFRKTLGWQLFLMKDWLQGVRNLIYDINPSLIRCYGINLNLLLAVDYKKKYKVPLLVSLHTHPYLDNHKEPRSIKEKIIRWIELKIAVNLHQVDLVLPVYQGIKNYLDDLKIVNYRVLYNTVAVHQKKHVKLDWSYNGVFKIVCIGQQISNKNPVNLIHAVAQLEDVSLDIIGKGNLHTFLKELVISLGVENKIRFIESIPHLELCGKLRSYDIFAASIDCIGLSKTVIESFLVGLPVLLNINSKVQVPELSDLICLRVPDTVEGYVFGINKMKKDQRLRELFAKRASEQAWNLWAPDITEENHKEIYQLFLTS